ncbi:carboxylesterase family protein [Ruegeria sp. HKCCD8929]|uniref:carboxylesterase family protein n=1 Tax=Ruegeria sp. HKCCD8929 TaxID=2683006 RepID=UPI00148871FA|nr:carboxylesterase family protein [Ruegeria sp. HKCCD8929]
MDILLPVTLPDAEKCNATTSTGAVYSGLQLEECQAFLGIPYAERPVGNRRFLPPVDFDSEDHVDATRPGLSPPQEKLPQSKWLANRGQFEVGEDCLNLNIFTPAPDRGGRPVVVYVFGGGFQTGSANSAEIPDKDVAVSADCVFVRVNFRIGALGFLDLSGRVSTGESGANRGLLDLASALRWINRNIRHFGGDPDNVSLVGMSSGAFMIAALAGMEVANHLFRRVWLMSGSTGRIIEPDAAAELTDRFLHELEIVDYAIPRLETLSVQQILRAQRAIVSENLAVRNAPGGKTFGVVNDGKVLKHLPHQSIASGIWRDKALVAGWTKDEARFWFLEGRMPAPQVANDIVAMIGLFRPTGADEVFQDLVRQYPKGDLQELAELFLTNEIYKAPATKMIAAQKNCGGRGHAYEFSLVPPNPNEYAGAAHGFDEAFVFGQLNERFSPTYCTSDSAKELAARMFGAFRAYIRGGEVKLPFQTRCDFQKRMS